MPLRMPATATTTGMARSDRRTGGLPGGRSSGSIAERRNRRRVAGSEYCVRMRERRKSFRKDKAFRMEGSCWGWKARCRARNIPMMAPKLVPAMRIGAQAPLFE